MVNAVKDEHHVSRITQLKVDIESLIKEKQKNIHKVLLEAPHRLPDGEGNEKPQDQPTETNMKKRRPQDSMSEVEAVARQAVESMRSMRRKHTHHHG